MAGRYALIVANGTYRDTKLSRLRTPTRDAEELARVLGDPAIGDFEVNLSIDEPEHALRRRIAAFFAGRDRDDLLLLHFSCHGLKDDSGQLYFAATDTEVAHLDATAVSAEFVSRQMTRSRSRKVVALLDCCYSGAIARGLRFRAGDTVQLHDHLGGHGRVILTASSAMEYAFEGEELTGSGSPSVFTSAVVKALETGEADRDQDNRISVDELYDYVCQEVREVTPDQSPNMISHLEGELYLARSTYVAPIDPASLPAELHAAIESPFAGVREGAVTELSRLVGGGVPASAAAARAALHELARDDSRRVAAAAAAALTSSGAESGTGPAAPVAAPAAAPPARPAVPARPLDDRSGALAAAIVAAVGALLTAGGLIGMDWPDSGTVDAVVSIGCVAAVLGAVVVSLPASRRRPVLDAAAIACAAFPFGVALAAERIQHGESAWRPSLTVVGTLLVAGAALWQARRWSPRPRAPNAADALLLLSAAVLAAGSSDTWVYGESPNGMLLAVLTLAVLIAITAALAGVPVGPVRRIAHRALIAAPAAGAFAVGATLTIATVASAGGGAPDPGAEVAFWSGGAMAAAGMVSLVLRRPG